MFQRTRGSIVSDVVQFGGRYAHMMDMASVHLPYVLESLESFNKASSQLKTVTLDINDLTPIGTARHIVAAIDRTRKALKESEISAKRKDIDLRHKRAQLSTTSDFAAERLQVDIVEIESQLEDLRSSQRGAIRKLAFLTEQYRHVCEALGVEAITEEMYERDQATYHVMRALSQALAAARARGGLIDEGNFIYLQDLGINGAAAQREITAYFEAEQEILNKGRVPTFEMQAAWLRAMAEKFAGEVTRYAESRGLAPLVRHALAQPSTEEITA